MPGSPTKFIKRWSEFIERSERNNVPKDTRGIYVLVKYRRKLKKYDVVYIGMSGAEKGRIKSRLGKHAKSKKDLWTHFSIFEVWDNVSQDEIKELEGLFRTIYKEDTRANKLNKQKGSKLLKKVKVYNLDNW